MIFGFHEPKVPTVEPEAIKKAMDSKEDFVLLDVRTPGEYSRGKLEGSINVPVDEVPQKVESVIPDKSKTIYVYCLSGARSTVAVETMMRQGYTKVFNIAHGMLAWRAKYLPVV